MLQLDNTSVTFNRGAASEVRALRGVSLDVPQGDFVTVIGANGAGKSTLFNIVAGTIEVGQGRVLLDEQDITDWPEHRRSQYIGRVFQNPSLGTCPGLTVFENLSLASLRGRRPALAPGYRRDKHDEFYERLRDFDMKLEDRLNTDVSMLSGGQRQAVTLLMATLTQPKLLLLDEHTAALDPNAAAQIIDLTVRLAETYQLTVIMITHSMQQACSVGNRIVMMNRGEVIDQISGAEHEGIGADDLIGRFRALKQDAMLSDRALLS
jgi:putative tryptophan/tyrosine transport system ATP-binding protein